MEINIITPIVMLAIFMVTIYGGALALLGLIRVGGWVDRKMFP